MEEITSLVCFLLSDEATSCTGGLFVADGGYSCGLATYDGGTPDRSGDRAGGGAGKRRVGR